MGVFIARVSRGRTFKETVLATLVGGSAGCALFFMIFGNNALYQQLNGGFDFLAVAKASGVDAAIIGALGVLPLFPLILGLFIFTGFVYSATTIDSSAYSMATVSSKDLKPGHEPSVFARIFWALVLAGVALAVMNIGSLGAVQTASLVAAFPILIFSAIAIWSFLKYLKADQPHLKKPSPAGTEIEGFLID
jgi:BCCT family betaine/carnitine transporter